MIFGMEISKPLGRHGLSLFIFSKEAHPCCFGSVRKESFKFSGFSNAFCEFQKSLFAKAIIFVWRCVFICLFSDNSTTASVHNEFGLCVPQSSIREVLKSGTWTSIVAVQHNSSFSCTFSMAQPEDKERNNVIGLCMLVLSLRSFV